MNELGMGLAPAKHRGEWAELIFMARASEHGLSSANLGEKHRITTLWCKAGTGRCCGCR